MKYFFNVETAEELKKEFKKLAIKLHPDNGGDAEQFKVMQAEFTLLFDTLKNTHRNKAGDIWEATGDSATTETAKEFMDIIERLMFISELEVEICGSWVWVGGNTKQYKDLLKELNFRYSGDKKMWYYTRDHRRKYRSKSWSMDQIRDVYGSEKYKGERDRLEGVA